ncbi:hypothetical protein H1R20_g5813, partial [Candolleomyces eurysporus]
MGLSGRKQKQRIPNDPRNLAWADDAARFGSSYLSKFGWDSSKGLGVSGEGRTTHIKVAQKLDMMGIGAAHMKDPNGIAWKQNRDFENLLKRLNESSEVEVKGESEVTTVEVEVRAESVVEVESEEGKKEKKEKKEKREKREKKKDKESKKEKKRKLEEEEDGKEKKKRRKTSEEPQEEDVQMKESSPPATAPAPKPVHRFRSHRARAIAAKSISSKSSVHISEILGIAPTPSTSSQSASGSATPAEGKLTQISDIPELEKITTSTKSVADYFKEKLSLKSSSKTSPAATPTNDSDASQGRDYDDERPMGGLGFSRLRFEVREESQVEEETMRMGLSKFSSLMSSTFLSATATTPSSFEETPEIEQAPAPEEEASPEVEEEEESREERKRRKKERKERKKAEAEAKEEKKKKKKKSAENSEVPHDGADLDGDQKSTKKKRKSKHRGEDST